MLEMGCSQVKLSRLWLSYRHLLVFPLQNFLQVEELLTITTALQPQVRHLLKEWRSKGGRREVKNSPRVLVCTALKGHFTCLKLWAAEKRGFLPQAGNTEADSLKPLFLLLWFMIIYDMIARRRLGAFIMSTLTKGCLWKCPVVSSVQILSKDISIILESKKTYKKSHWRETSHNRKWQESLNSTKIG